MHLQQSLIDWDFNDKQECAFTKLVISAISVRTMLSQGCMSVKFEMGSDVSKKYLAALVKEAAAGDDVAFLDIIQGFPCIYITGEVPNLKTKP